MLFPKYLETFEQEVPALVASKELTYSEGFENAEVALDNSIKGAVTGKAVVILADE
ncbi:hypothetical protein JVT61DRAFT_13995 [Boletus reticuloceps]|uniref:Uncharacterized protein n=1 Tax=Boletus reticuloceps TaxID=495285 RepID=A0A8I2YTJ5_9AGAM|nr:hypothetical protein JVT61DRAFT_13995 [Boletus reticuloceps]